MWVYFYNPPHCFDFLIDFALIGENLIIIAWEFLISVSRRLLVKDTQKYFIEVPQV